MSPVLRVAIHGQSFGEANISGDLTANYPPADSGWFNIGRLHTCLEGDARHYAYAPVSAGRLAAKGYQYWALGHIHQRRVMECDGVPLVFPGNPQGRYIPEIGPKGCQVVSVDDDGRVESRFEPLDVVRWLEEIVDLTGASSWDEVDRSVIDILHRAKRAHSGRLLAIRLHLRGETEMTSTLHRREGLLERFNSLAIDTGDVWLERILPETLPPKESADSPLAEDIRELMEEIAGDEGQLRAWMEAFSPLAALLGDFEDAEVSQALIDPLAFRDWIRRAAALCLVGEETPR